jgi:cell division septation protein DedD
LTGQNGAVYVVRVGPISDRDRASSLARQLADTGFPSTNLTGRLQYRVVSEPLPRSVAQGLASRLAGRGIQSTLQPLSSDTAQLLFGIFGSQKDADALSQRIAAQGYDAWVREGGTYVLRVGPYPKTAVKAIADIVKASAPEAAIAADPVPSQASPPAGAPAVPSSAPGSAAPRLPAASPPSVPAPRTPAPPPPAAPAAAPAVSAPQPAPPPGRPAPPQGSGYMVRVGPMSDADRASAIARQLAAGGFASATVARGTAFRVVSEPLPRSAADRVVALLGGRGVHSKVEPVNGDTVQILFGSFATQKEAEDLSQRISAQGYDAWVREATVYTVQVGPYPQSAVPTITGIVKSGAPDAAVTTESVP